MTIDELRSALHLCEEVGVDPSITDEILRDFDYQVKKGIKLFDELTELRAQLAEYQADRRLCQCCKHEYTDLDSRRCQPCFWNKHSNKPNFEAK